MDHTPTEAWLSEQEEGRSALLYRGDGSGLVTLGRHDRKADVPVRRADLTDALCVSKIAAVINTVDSTIARTGASALVLLFKDGSLTSAQMSVPYLLGHMRAIEFPTRPALLWEVMVSEASIQLLEPGQKITHVIPRRGINFDFELRRKWDARLKVRDASGWRVDELVSDGRLSEATRARLAHVYHE